MKVFKKRGVIFGGISFKFDEFSRLWCMVLLYWFINLMFVRMMLSILEYCNVLGVKKNVIVFVDYVCVFLRAVSKGLDSYVETRLAMFLF